MYVGIENKSSAVSYFFFLNYFRKMVIVKKWPRADFDKDVAKEGWPLNGFIKLQEHRKRV